MKGRTGCTELHKNLQHTPPPGIAMNDPDLFLGSKVLLTLTPTDCPVSWMRNQLHPDAISIADRLPDHRQHVIGWVSAPGVCIYFDPAIVWRTPGIGRDEWWAGLPGSYIDLQRHGWNLSHWKPL